MTKRVHVLICCVVCWLCCAVQYDFYFAYCEAGFDAKYIHDFHVTWQKRATAASSSSNASAVAQARAMAAVAVGDVAGHGVAWMKQELQQQLPSDSITQVGQRLGAGRG
jgi:hypothetical protein